MSPWGWIPDRTQGIWKHGAGWIKPAATAVPWITVGVLLTMIHLIGGTLTQTSGTLFELPDSGLSDGEASGLVVFLMPTDHETLIFFDDARYMLGDAASVSSFDKQLRERVQRAEKKSLLVLVDRRVSCGDIMRFASLAKAGGVQKVSFAEKGAEISE